MGWRGGGRMGSRSAWAWCGAWCAWLGLGWWDGWAVGAGHERTAGGARHLTRPRRGQLPHREAAGDPAGRRTVVGRVASRLPAGPGRAGRNGAGRGGGLPVAGHPSQSCSAGFGPGAPLTRSRHRMPPARLTLLLVRYACTPTCRLPDGGLRPRACQVWLRCPPPPDCRWCVRSCWAWLGPRPDACHPPERAGCLPSGRLLSQGVAPCLTLC